jgi:hypothetical protein
MPSIGDCYWCGSKYDFRIWNVVMIAQKSVTLLNTDSGTRELKTLVNLNGWLCVQRHDPGQTKAT